MLHEFLSTHRAELIARTRARVAKRTAPRPTDEELERGVPFFLDQLVAILHSSPGSKHVTPDLETAAAQHGAELLKKGFTISQVVSDYGDVCQAVTELAEEMHVPISVDDYKTFNLCLDNATSQAVTEYGRGRERVRDSDETERLGLLAHELRNKLSAAMLGFSTIRSGQVGVGGSMGNLVWRSMRGIRDLIDQSLAQVRLEAGAPPVTERIPVAHLLEEIETEASLEAAERKIAFTVTPVGDDIAIEGERPIITAALINLLQNAFKFTHFHGQVTLRTSAAEGRVRFDVEDECGGLPGGRTADLFQPFSQSGKDRRGIGLGLTISRRAAETHGGSLTVRDMPGSGCVFTLDLPRHP